MKNVLLILAFMPLCIFAQNVSRDQARITYEINTATDPYLAEMSMDVPEEFQSYSAVILASILEERYEGKLNNLQRQAYRRLIIKIQDKAALEDLSTFNLDSRYNKGSLMSLKDIKQYSIVIKKQSGETVELDLEKMTKNADDEIAIPNLEVGDVIDYGLKIAAQEVLVSCFSPKWVVLNDDYPTLHGHNRMFVERGFFINFKALNGAPEMKLNEELTTRKEMVYDLKYNNLEAYKAERWAPLYRSAKNYRMQVCYYPVGKADSAPLLLGSPYEIKTTATQEEKERVLKEAYGSLTKFSGDDNTAYFYKWLGKNYPVKPTGDEFMKVAYYHFRYHILIFNPVLNTYKEDYETRYIKEEYFARFLSYLARKEGINSGVVFAANKYYSSFDDIIMLNEFDIAFRYKSESGDWKILYPFTSFETMGYSNERYEGQTALFYDGKDFERITIPESSWQENIYVTRFEITPDLETRNASVKSTASTLGSFKHDYSYSVLKNTGFHDDAQKAALPEGKEDVMLQNRRAQRGIEKTGAAIEADKDEKLKSMKKTRSSEFDIEEYTAFELVNSGVMSSEDSLIFKEAFTVKNVLEKAGPNYIIDLSKVSIDQASFTDEEKTERVNNIMLDFPKTYEYIYTINVPSGYVPVGLENFDADSSNDFGAVALSASFENGIVKVHLIKSYKKSEASTSDWPSFMEFLEPAMRMNDAKIVLKKG